MYSRGPVPFTSPYSGENFHTRQDYLVLPKCLWHFNFLAVIVMKGVPNVQ